MRVRLSWHFLISCETVKDNRFTTLLLVSDKASSHKVGPSLPQIHAPSGLEKYENETPDVFHFLFKDYLIIIQL